MDVMIAMIAILTIIDLVCTAIGLSQGYIVELNPIMAWLFEWSMLGTYVIVVVVVGVCLYIISRFMKRYKWVRYVVVGLVGIKIIVVMLHCVWIGAFFMR